MWEVGHAQKTGVCDVPALQKSNRRVMYQNDPFFEKRSNQKLNDAQILISSRCLHGLLEIVRNNDVFLIYLCIRFVFN